MTEINKELLVPYSAEQMYSLVNDIEQYPEFLDWCSKANILEQSKDSITAKLNLAYSGFEQSFTTKNIIEPHNKVTMSLVDGPFKNLDGIWLFTDINNAGSKVEFKLDFEFDNFFMAMTFNKVFSGMVEKMVDCFYQRAKQVYG